MSWLFSQALVEAFSEANSWDGEPSALLSVMPTPHKFWRNDRTMEPSRLSQFGLTCAVLTEDRGAALLTWFLEASRARTSQWLDEGKASRGNAPGSGRNSLGSLARFDPTSRSWRTPQPSLFGASEPFSATWPRWGSMRSGVCWGRLTPARPTSETESGFWATPQAHDCHAGNPDRVGRFGTKAGGRNLNDEVMMWPTLLASDSKGSLGVHRGDGRLKRNLAREVKLWPTPLATDGKNGGPNSRGSKGDLRLSAAVFQVPTPKARDYRTGDKPESRRAREKRTGERHSPDLNDVVAHGGQLNPDWVEWLMGWPIGWTDLNPLETARFQQWPHSHSEPYTAA